MRSPAAAYREPHASSISGGASPAIERAARFALSGRLRLLLLGALLVIGIVGMHSLLPPPAHGASASVVTPAATSGGQAHGQLHHHVATSVTTGVTGHTGHTGLARAVTPVTPVTTALPAHPTAETAAGAGACHSGHSGGADHGGDGGSSCGSQHLLMLCAAILIAFASLVIALTLRRGRLTRALYVVRRWTRLPGTLLAHQLFAGPLTPREVTCVHRC